jgi:hypothetical protein
MSKIYNGGIIVKIGTQINNQQVIKKLDLITAYDPSWDLEAETFEAWDFSEVQVLKGRRFRLSITTGFLDATDLNSLKAVLITRQVTVYCPEYTTGILMAVDSVSQPLKVSNYNGSYYQISFSLRAVSVEGCATAYNTVDPTWDGTVSSS